MKFIIHCVDKKDHQHVRQDNRPLHLTYVQNHLDQVVVAGPTLAEDGEGMTGSVLIMEFSDRAAAEAFAADDPYNKAGLFESVTITPWKQVLPKV